MIFQRKYNTATTSSTHIRIPLTKRGSVDHAASGDWTPASGDVRVRIDGGSWANIGTLPTASATGSNAGQSFWEFQFTGAELSGKQIAVAIGDASSGKAVEDDGFIIETFGHASAMYPYDVSADNSAQELTDIADAVLKRDWTSITGEPPARSIWSALRKIRNRWTVTGGNTLTVYREDDSTQAYTEAVTSAAGNPITGSDPN